MINTYPISDATIAERQIALYAMRVEIQGASLESACEGPYCPGDYVADAKFREHCSVLAQNLRFLRYWQGKLHEASITSFMVIVSRECKGCGIGISDSRVYCDECLIEENV
jgi:hypothetical protein